MEIGTQLAVGDVFKGLDAPRCGKIRAAVAAEAFGSRSAREFPLVTFCPITVHQAHGGFGGDWNREFCEMIDSKNKLVSKRYHEMTADAGARRKADTGPNCGPGSRRRLELPA